MPNGVMVQSFREVNIFLQSGSQYITKWDARKTERWSSLLTSFKILLNNQTILPLFLFSKGHFVRSLQEMLGKFSSRETTLMQFQQLQMRPNIYPLKTTS